MEFFCREEKGLCWLYAFCRRNTDVSAQSEERLPMKFSKLVETVSKKPILPHVKHLIVEVMVSDEDGEDVEVRFLLTQFLSLIFCLQVPFIVVQI